MIKKPTQGFLYFDVDDFMPDPIHYHLVQEIFNKRPDVKLSLFAPVFYLSPSIVEDFNSKFGKFAELLPHGFRHDSSREMQNWSFSQSNDYLDYCEYIGLKKIIRAPGWNASDELVSAIEDRGWVLADHPQYLADRSPNLKIWYCNPNQHFHIGCWGKKNKNDLFLNINSLLTMKGVPCFISEAWGT